MSALELLAASPGVFIAVSVVLGLMVGSFLNVVIYRVPLMLERQWREQCAEGAAATDASAAAASAPAAPPAGIPERFNLIVPDDGLRLACRIVWHREYRMGVTFD